MKFPPRRDALYTQDELTEMVSKMRVVSHDFYGAAVRTGCHTFIEFCGLMNKYIDVCDRSAKSNIDFTSSSIHMAGVELPVEDHDVIYLAEKFACIFAATLFRKPKIWETFKAAVDHELGRSDPLEPSLDNVHHMARAMMRSSVGGDDDTTWERLCERPRYAKNVRDWLGKAERLLRDYTRRVTS